MLDALHTILSWTESAKVRANGIEKMLAKNVIEPAQTKGAAPFMLVLKEDELLQLCVNYRILSNVPAFDSYPILRREDSIDFFDDMTTILKLDSNIDYW